MQKRTALIGVFWQDGGSPYSFTTLRGQTAQIYGQWIYRYDTVFAGAGFRGTDAVTLLVGLPLLILSFLRYRCGSLRGGIVLTGALSFFLYNGASMTFAAAFNPLFLAYTLLFSTSLFAFILAITAVDLQTLPERFSARLPRGGIGIFLIIGGLAPLFLWLSEIIGPLLTGQAPANLGPYTTMFTHAFDIGLISPAAILAGVCLLRRSPLGYLLAAPILILCTLIGLVMIAQTIFQTNAGIHFPTGVLIGMIVSWILLGLFAIGFTASFLRNLNVLQVQPKSRSEVLTVAQN